MTTGGATIGKNGQKCILTLCWLKCNVVQPWKSLSFSHKVEHNIPHNLAILLLSINNKNKCLQKACVQMFTAGSLISNLKLESIHMSNR